VTRDTVSQALDGIGFLMDKSKEPGLKYATDGLQIAYSKAAKTMGQLFINLAIVMYPFGWCSPHFLFVCVSCTFYVTTPWRPAGLFQCAQVSTPQAQARTMPNTPDDATKKLLA
jgi:hypothetical protein